MGACVKVAEAPGDIDELRLYTKQDVAERSRRSVRSVDEDSKRDDCPLKWSRHRGKCVCDAATLRRYLEWLIEQGRAGRKQS